MALAATLYAVLALFAVRALLPAPASRFLYPTFLSKPLIDASWLDQQFDVARVAQVAAGVPWRAGGGGPCHPLPRSDTLGEHMWAECGLAVVPFALTRDPVLTYNVVFVLSLWTAACAMYLLVHHWTGSAPAAFLAGCLFAFHPLKVGDPAHPSVHANQWAALALLFAYRLFAFERWRDAVLLAVCASLQVLESFYSVVSFTVVGGVYGTYLVVRHLHRLPALAPKILVCAAVVALVAAAVYQPYLHTRATWGTTLTGRTTTLHRPSEFGPYGRSFPGWAAGALAGFAVLDRLRGRLRRGEDDPRLPLLAAGLAAAWVSTGPIAVPGTTLTIPAPLEALRGVLPGLDAIRAAMNVGDGFQLTVAFLAGVGAARLLAAWPRWARGLAVAGLTGVVLAEFFLPWTGGGFTRGMPLGTLEARPPADLADLAASLPSGAVLDLPFVLSKQSDRSRGHYLLLSAFHLRPTAACHNSFASPLDGEINRLVLRLPDVAAADALYALGFRTLVLHHETLEGGAPPWAAARLDPLRDRGRIEEIGTAADHTAFALHTPLPVRQGFERLTPLPEHRVARLFRPRDALSFTIQNAADAVYRHPDPLQPTCLVRWYATSGHLVAAQEERSLLPLALGAGEHDTRTVLLTIPVDDGVYDVTLAPREAPDVVVGRRRVRVKTTTPSAP